MSEPLPKDSLQPPLEPDTRGTTEILAVDQTRRQILDVLDRYGLADLRTEFLTSISENATSHTMAMAIVTLKERILRTERDDVEDIIERIDTRTVLPSSRPPHAAKL